MLSAEHRLRSSRDFRLTVRRGHRAPTRTLVVHGRRHAGGPRRIGFVVSKQVGSAVIRNRVKRRLRHLVRERIGGVPASTHLVVRALPAAAGASSVLLGLDLDEALAKVDERVNLQARRQTGARR